MINPNFVILGAFIQFLGALSYLIDTLKGKTKPNKASWFIWTLAPLTAFAAEVSKGVGIQSLMTFMVGFNPLLILIASFFNKKADWKLGKLDYICTALALAGIFLWAIIKDGNIAILFAILADALAAVPTIVKAYFYPETENHWAYSVALISAVITLLAIDRWDFAHYGFPINVLVVCIILVSLIKFKIGKKLKHLFS